MLEALEVCLFHVVGFRSYGSPVPATFCRLYIGYPYAPRCRVSYRSSHTAVSRMVPVFNKIVFDHLLTISTLHAKTLCTDLNPSVHKREEDMSFIEKSE